MDPVSHALQLKQEMELEKVLVRLANVTMINLLSMFSYLSAFALIQIVSLMQLVNASLALTKLKMELEKLMALSKHVHVKQHLFGMLN